MMQNACPLRRYFQITRSMPLIICNNIRELSDTHYYGQFIRTTRETWLVTLNEYKRRNIWNMLLIMIFCFCNKFSSFPNCSIIFKLPFIFLSVLDFHQFHTSTLFAEILFSLYFYKGWSGQDRPQPSLQYPIHLIYFKDIWQLVPISS